MLKKKFFKNYFINESGECEDYHEDFLKLFEKYKNCKKENLNFDQIKIEIKNAIETYQQKLKKQEQKNEKQKKLFKFF